MADYEKRATLWKKNTLIEYSLQIIHFGDIDTASKLWILK